LVIGGRMMLSIKNAHITGSSREIGQGIALEFARQGANVAVNYAGNDEKAQEVVDELLNLGVQAFKIQADVSNEANVKDMAKEVIKKSGRLDILVNNAGI